MSDFVKAGGKKYNLVTDNCIHGAKRMTNLGNKKPSAKPNRFSFGRRK